MPFFKTTRRAFVALSVSVSAAAAQQGADAGALILRHGTDTVVVDRFRRTADTLVGSMQVKGQPRVDYVVILAPGEMVRSMTISVFAAGAAPASAPLQRIRVLMQGDSAIVETPAGLQRVATKTGAIPMVNNGLAISELFVRRARLSGGIADIPYFALSGGATIVMNLRPIGTDSIVTRLAQQETHFKADGTGRILGGTIAAAGYEFLRAGPEAAANLDVARPDVPIAPPRDYSAPRDAPYTAENVRVPGPDGITLGGTLTKPSNASGRLPAVVTITGSGQQDRDEFIPFAGGVRLFGQIADTLGRRGIAVLRLDDRGIGDSGGDPRTSTSEDFARDIRAAVAFLRARPDIDPARIALVGHSEGGMIGPMIAADDHQLKALVVLAGPGEAPIELSMAQNRYIVDQDASITPMQRDSVLRAARASLAPEKQSNPWLRYWMGFDPAPVYRRITAPTLIVQGATDRQVPVDQAEKLAALIRAGGNTDITVKVIPAMNHLFVSDPDGNFANYDKLKSNKIVPAALGAVADWLALKLGVVQ